MKISTPTSHPSSLTSVPLWLNPSQNPKPENSFLESIRISLQKHRTRGERIGIGSGKKDGRFSAQTFISLPASILPEILFEWVDEVAHSSWTFLFSFPLLHAFLLFNLLSLLSSLSSIIAKASQLIFLCFIFLHILRISFFFSFFSLFLPSPFPSPLLFPKEGKL